MASITLLNFNIDKEIDIHYPLAYLHGVVKEGHATSVTCINRAVLDQQSVDWPIKDGEFKVFVFVAEGKNEVVLKLDGEVEVVVNVKFTKIKSSRYILPIYIICKNSDGSFMAPPGVSNTAEEAIRKIQLNARLMQTYVAESLYDQGFERKTFSYSEDEDGKPLVNIVNSEIDIDEIKGMTRDQLYHSFRKELLKLLPKDDLRKMLVFMSCTRYNPPPDVTEFTVEKIQSYATGHAALGGGDMALFGSGSLYTWASSLDELNLRFTDTTVVDRTQLFDDSCGRGTYMANYSTTLGATVHELGHAFDLAHTPHGIMCRGHDDMNYFYTVVEKPVKGSDTKEVSRSDTGKLHDTSCKSNTTELAKGAEKSSSTHLTDATCKYRGAHWYRSSAVVLNYHKWFNPSFSSEDTAVFPITKTLHPNLLGPLGNVGIGCQKDQVSFNSQIWLEEKGLTLIGVVLYHHEYLCGLQFLGMKYEVEDGESKCVDEEQASDIFGTFPESAIKTTFYFNEPDERLISITIRSGAYIDGIELLTNKKCSEWAGGEGGDVSVFNIESDRFIQTCFGTAGKYVGSIGFILNSIPNLSVRKNVISIGSDNGIRLIETHDSNGEVHFFREYLDEPAPQSISVLTKHLFVNEKVKVDGMIIDNAGEKLTFSLTQSDLDLISTIE